MLLMESGQLDQVGPVAAVLLPGDFVVTVEAPAGAPDDEEQSGGLHVGNLVQAWL